MSALPLQIDRPSSAEERAAFAATNNAKSSSIAPDRLSDPFQRRPLEWRILDDGTPPQRDWAIEGWLGIGHGTLLAGLGGIGKTLLGQMIGSCVAVERPFIDVIPRARIVLMWAGEDDHDELWRRQLAIAAWLGIPLSAFAGKFYLESFADRDCTLMDLDLGGRLVQTAMLEELSEQIADYDAEVVILDNAARMFGGKESDRNQVTRFIAGLNAAAAKRRSPGAAVLLLAHPGRAPGSEYSGSSAWENSVRARMFLADRPPDAHLFDESEDGPPTDRRFLAKRKTNYSAKELRTFMYQAGVLVPEAVPDSGGLIDSLGDRRDETIVVYAFRKLVNEIGQQPTDGDSSPNFLPKLICQFNLGDGRTKRDLDRAMRRLMVTGTLKREIVGKYANRNPRYGLVLSNATSS